MLSDLKSFLFNLACAFDPPSGHWKSTVSDFFLSDLRRADKPTDDVIMSMTKLRILQQRRQQIFLLPVLCCCCFKILVYRVRGDRKREAYSLGASVPSRIRTWFFSPKGKQGAEEYWKNKQTNKKHLWFYRARILSCNDEENNQVSGSHGQHGRLLAAYTPERFYLTG